jgi:hypothetical protein
LNTDGNSEMIIRGLIRAQGPRNCIRHSSRATNRHSQVSRQYSTANAPSMSCSAPQSQASMLATITTDLDKIAPRFEIQPEQIQILRTPTEFYETLKVGYITFSRLSPFPHRVGASKDQPRRYSFLKLVWTCSLQDDSCLSLICQIHSFFFLSAKLTCLSF